MTAIEQILQILQRPETYAVLGFIFNAGHGAYRKWGKWQSGKRKALATAVNGTKAALATATIEEGVVVAHTSNPNLVGLKLDVALNTAVELADYYKDLYLSSKEELERLSALVNATQPQLANTEFHNHTSNGLEVEVITGNGNNDSEKKFNT